MGFSTHGRGPRSRRRVKRTIQTAAITTVTLLGVVGCAGSSGDGGGSGQVVVAGWGGAIQDAQIKYIYEPFTEETGIEVIVSGPPNTARIKAMVDSGNVEWDLVEGTMDYIGTLGREYFQKFPDSVLETKGMNEDFVDEYGVGYYTFTTNIGWNTDKYEQGMESWADFWDFEKFPGTRTLQGGQSGPPPIELALLADGVPVDELYPLDLDRAFEKLDELKPHVPQWWSSGSQPGQMMISGQADAASIWSGRVYTLQQEGAAIEKTWNSGMFNTTRWVVPNGAKHAENAFKLAEYSIQPEVQARVWGHYPAGPTNMLAFESMDEEWAKTLPTHPSNVEKGFEVNHEWWGEHRAEAVERWNEWVLK